MPAFAVFPMRRKVKAAARLALPLIVKSLNEDGSHGISQASIIDTDEKLTERVAFIHERIKAAAAIAEQFIEEWELCGGVLGNNPAEEAAAGQRGLQFGTMGSAHHIATEKVKHDARYRERVSIVDGPAKDLTPELSQSHSTNGEAHLPDAGTQCFCAHRFSPLAPRQRTTTSKLIPITQIAKSQKFATAPRHDEFAR